MTTTLIPRRMRPADSRPTVLLKVDTSDADDPGEFLREVAAQVRKAGFRALAVEADGPVEILGAATDQFLRHTYGPDPTPSTLAKLVEDLSTPVGHLPGDDVDYQSIFAWPSRPILELPEEPSLRPGARVRVTRNDLTAGSLATVIGPEDNGVPAAPLPGWWVRVDRGKGPYAGALLWYRTDELEPIQDQPSGVFDPNRPSHDARPGQCSCVRCNTEAGVPVWWMAVCDTCGNKRCPHSTDHRFECTGSNDPGEPGSRYGGTQ